MREQFKANLRAHILYYRRSRLLLAFALVFLGMTLLYSLPALFSPLQGAAFSAAREIFTTLNMFLTAFSAGLGLFIVSSHLRDRNLKMVFTKPCPPEWWLASAYLSAVLVSALVNAAILACALAVSLVAHAKIQAGLAFVSLDTFAGSLALTAYFMFLAMIIHPVIAVVFALVFNPSIFYHMQIWTQALINSGAGGAFLRLVERLFHILYMTFPMVHPFSRETSGIENSLRVETGHWHYAFYSLGYALALTALSYCLSLFFLRRKKLI